MSEPVDGFKLVSFATEAFLPYRQRLVDSANRHGIEVDDARLWDEHRLRKTDFYEAHREILDLGRGAGYWLWKPYIVLQALESAAPDELILYVDSTLQIAGDLDPLRRALRSGDDIMLFQDGHLFLNKSWTKRDAFVLMGCDTPAYWFAPQLHAGVVAFRNTERARSFVREWLGFCQDPRILTDQPNERGLPNWIDFFEHRHDQSVLTNLRVKWGIDPYRQLSSPGRDYTMRLDYKDESGVVHHLKYAMSPSPYGDLTLSDPTRPSKAVPTPTILQRWGRKLRNAARALRS